ncbi:MAG: hypothetical protein Q9160_007507 [Pyrenula sp. 1 TL-2023]
MSAQDEIPQVNVEAPAPSTSTQADPTSGLAPFPSLSELAASSQPNRNGDPIQPTTSYQIPRRPLRHTRQTSSLRPPSVRIRRLPSTPSLRDYAGNDGATDDEGRRRSTSAPQRPQWLEAPSNDLTRQTTAPSTPMPPVVEDVPYEHPQTPEPPSESGLAPASSPGRFRRASNAALSRFSRPRASSAQTPAHEYDAEVVDLLDVVDPEVATLSTLTNVQNSLFIPDLGRWINRRPTYELSRRPTEVSQIERADAGKQAVGIQTIPSRTGTPVSRFDTAPTQPEQPDQPEKAGDEVEHTDSRVTRTTSISSTMSESRYAVLPHGVVLTGWSQEDISELNDHVRHQLHSRRAKFKRRMRGFGKYVRRPLGFFVTLYATLITLFGLAWVLFLIGWINVGGRQLYIINIIDNVLVALFAIMGDGLAPFRAVDTYHMIFIAHYHHLTWRLRREKSLPKLENENDLPADRPASADIEAGMTEEKHEYSVLTPKQQDKLAHHQAKFAKSHTFYRPHETTTHYAFPLRLLVAVVVLLDCHSLLQIALGTCTWSISYHVRPFALTTVILCCSISVNIAAGITISVGDRMTRKKDVIEQHFRQGLTDHALTKMEKKKGDRLAVKRPAQPSRRSTKGAWAKMIGKR